MPVGCPPGHGIQALPFSRQTWEPSRVSGSGGEGGRGVTLGNPSRVRSQGTATSALEKQRRKHTQGRRCTPSHQVVEPAVREATKEENREVGLNNDLNRYKREKKRWGRETGMCPLNLEPKKDTWEISYSAEVGMGVGWAARLLGQRSKEKKGDETADGDHGSKKLNHDWRRKGCEWLLADINLRSRFGFCFSNTGENWACQINSCGRK